MKQILYVITVFSLFSAGLYAENSFSFNQFNENYYSGMQRNVLKLSIGGSYENPPSQSVGLVTGRFEYLTSDHFGIRGSAGVLAANKVSGYRYAPFMLGGDIHLFPRSVFDLYFGGDGGFLYVKDPVRGKGWFARTSIHTGATLYFGGISFIEAEVSYNVQHLATNPPLDLSSLGYTAMVGFYF